MDISVANIRKLLINVNLTLKSNVIERILKKKNLLSDDIDEVIDTLCNVLFDDSSYVIIVQDYNFGLLLPIVSKFLNYPENDFSDYQRKCVVLSILAEKNIQVLRYSYQYFKAKEHAPFHRLTGVNHAEEPKRKKIKLYKISDLQLIEMCLRFLKLDTSFYRRQWDWSEFISRFHNKGCDVQKLYCNQVVSILFGINNFQMAKLNKDIPTDIFVKIDIEKLQFEEDLEICSNDNYEQTVQWTFKSDSITNVDGVFLPIYNKSVKDFYDQRRGNIVRTKTTKINLRSLALGISSGKALCLSGPVGCGKTTLVEYIAKKTGRLQPKDEDFSKFLALKVHDVTDCIKRKAISNCPNNAPIDYSLNGFLRIQLGDQTDSKILLGQYRCTDIPGEFVWQAGILTQAVMNGYWLLLEDIDSATQDVYTVLTNLLENNYLSVPGYREKLKINDGFQLFFTLRTQKLMSQSMNSSYTLLEKYLYTINVLPLSKTELAEVVCENYPKLSTIALRIVDVFLIFSKGCHTNDLNIYDIESSSRDKSGNKSLDILSHSNNTLPGNSINSSRMVSTRDLLKLCDRSNSTFQVTSTECAFIAFQNCVDLFCSHLPAGELKTNLIISIGARLGIIESRCIHLANEFKPFVKLTTDDINIGRGTLSRGSSNELLVTVEKKIKLSESDTIRNTDKFKTLPPPTFSFTRVSASILERITVAAQQNEPILLVGETGTGKTSSVQYLAYQTNHKLVVVNMNNQSDVSDLIGGYKPVEMSFIITPLRNEFENLFVRTFDVIRNERFLSHIAECFNRGDYEILVKLILRVISNAYKICKEKNLKEELKSWKNLEVKLKKLDSQLKKSANLSFAFIPGSLVNCIRDGSWVLLDEINLATTETLECLSTILEAGGSIILLERGDYVPIKRHPDFRIFACMNPSTDVGKKDLPIGIRNRFTEFFVDELTAENDLLILVGDYLNNTGIEKSRIHKTVQLYKELKSLSQLELNDGLGNKPVFSLRTLCRALRICAKNLCGSIERNIYESFCLSFLTQLDLNSHDIVLQRIQKHLVSDVKKILSQQIPKPRGNQLNFEGYWIEQGTKEVEDCKEYILTDSVKKNLKDLARIVSIGKLPVLLQGPTSAGKTSLIEYIAKRSGNHCVRINNHEHTDLQEYIGTYMADHNGKLSFQEGVLVKAMRHGYWIILDELNLAPSDILEALNRVLDDNRELYIPETQVLVKAHPNFLLFATQNPPGLYGGRKILSRAFKNRFVELHFSEIPKQELEIILEKRCMIPSKYAQKMVKAMTSLQLNRRTTTRSNFTLRDLFRWGNRYTYADTDLLKDRNYDWNQHLVDEGYLVLSAKIRNQIENEVIVDTLYKNFSKKISIENLFSFNSKTSMVTKGILQSLLNYNGSQNIVWTFEMRRMAILVSKSLQFKEPVLLVGPTGCGKTTVCQILAELMEKKLRILNCHMHTESADFIGGLRPYRNDGDDDSGDKQQVQLFEWSDGPLIFSMIEGNFFLADEISLAEDAVLERLNCVLETERTLLLAEKGGVDDTVLKNNKYSELIIKANDGFQFLATMNPGGDYGKKELSPALRNRFTEIWCTADYRDEDLLKIAINSMEKSYDYKDEIIKNIANTIVHIVNVLKNTVEKLNFSIRDILAWVNYVTNNYKINSQNSILNIKEALYFGLQTIFLDSLEMLPYENFDDIATIRENIAKELEKTFKKFINSKENFSTIRKIEASCVEMDVKNLKFGIAPFYLKINVLETKESSFFSFSAPTTKNNLFRVLSAMSLKKAILLEGPPGVGKSSLIENIANTIGYKIVRINLCEHTDIADLFGTDLPAESSLFESDNNGYQLGSFEWRDGPLLAALKSPNTWILLDELNLAPQSVLEGLNAILDHRGEVYIPELNKTFFLNQDTRIFATQNPLRQGGGRKGLPKSFLNRFTKVYLKKLKRTDLFHVVTHSFDLLEEIDLLKNYKLIERMVIFSERVETGISNFEFGYKGGPFEANLRDMLRWCELLTNVETGFDIQRLHCSELFDDFLLTLFEKMKIVYCKRMRSESDVIKVFSIFGEIFECDIEKFQNESSATSIYWNNEKIFYNDIQWNRKSTNDFLSKDNDTIILSNQLELLKNLTECVILKKPVVICGPSDCGKSKLLNTFCTIFKKQLHFDTIDDSVTGSFQQFDFNRMLEELWQTIETILFKKSIELIMNEEVNVGKHKATELFSLWREYDTKENSEHLTMNNEKNLEVQNFLQRLELVVLILSNLKDTYDEENEELNEIKHFLYLVKLWKNYLQEKTSNLNTGGHFEWIDSEVVKSIKFGHYICLEHANLISSAILDRLNPILEPNGTLMITERGVGQNNEPEIVSKHKDFQIFFTIDPKHGEISRAMRNRCIEFSIIQQNYDEDDLRKLIFSQGVHEVYLIRAIIDIHKNICSLSNYSNFGVSHIVKMAFLVSQNKVMEADFRKILAMSAIEVYVRSSNADVLGFGLDYYRMKLKDLILETVKDVHPVQSCINYGNTVLYASELTTMTMIKLQAECLLGFLKCHKRDIHPTSMLFDLSSKFRDIEIENVEILERQLLAFLYMMSSFSELDKRKTYIHQMISSVTSSSKMQILNDKLYSTLIAFNNGNTPTDLPWNSKIFYRLRPYLQSKLTNCEEFKIVLSLFLEMELNDLKTQDFFKTETIDSITYSKAVQKKTFADTLNNKLITELYNILGNFKSFAKGTLIKCSTEMTDQQFMTILLSFMWYNRILNVSMEKLFDRNSVKLELLDELYLHFKWLIKNCINHLLSLGNLKTNENFVKSCNEIENFILSRDHSMRVLKKTYMKLFTSFLPLYEQKQILEFKEVNILKNLTTISPSLNDFEELQKRIALVLSTSYQSFRKELYANASSYVNETLSIFSKTQNNSENFELNDCQKANFPVMNHKITELENFLQSDEDVILRNDKFDIELLPILEYFTLVKAFPAAFNSSCKMNEEFVLNVQSINISVLLLMKILNDPRYDLIKKVFHNKKEAAKDDFKKCFESFMMSLDYTIQSSIHNSLCVNNQHYRSYIDADNYCQRKNYNNFINSPLLTSNALDLLLDNNGEARKIGLGEVQAWEDMLKNLNQVLWSNVELSGQKYDILQNKLRKEVRNAEKLLNQIDIVKEKCSMEKTSFSDFNQDFWKVVEYLKTSIENAKISSENLEKWTYSFTITSVCAIIDINLMSYFSLIDPVKKNSLKTKYMKEDINYLNHLLLCYKLMSTMLNYDNLGKENRRLIANQIEIIQEKLSKCSKKVALRPETCLYGSMVNEVNHFLISCCHPNHLIQIIDETMKSLSYKISSDDIFKNNLTSNKKAEISDLINKLHLWILSADKFTSHTLKKYNTFYRDFIAPIEYSLTSLKSGFLGLQSLLQMKHDAIEITKSGIYWSVNDNDKLMLLMKDLIDFPSNTSKDFKNLDMNTNVFSIIENIDVNGGIRFKMIKYQMLQVSNTSSITNDLLTPSLFEKFDTILNICNQLWQSQEDEKRRRQIEEDSLYVTKTKCLDVDEETSKIQEIAEIFPDNSENDFWEFIQNDTLEKVDKISKPKDNAKNVISDEDYKLIGEFFISLMCAKNHLSKRSHLKVFESKIGIFQNLYGRYRTCLDSSLDVSAYKSLCLLVGLYQKRYSDLEAKDLSPKSYNFYKDANTSEAVKCVNVMKRLEARANVELKQWPDHATLNDIILIINRIMTFSSTSPISRFNVGMQILRRKVDEWNRVAHRSNNFKDLENEIASLIQKWMQLELQCWRESLNQTYEITRGKAYRYWFFLYNLLHESLKSELVEDKNTSSIPIDFEKIDKQITNDNACDEKMEFSKVTSEAVTNVLKQFIESSNYAEYGLRMDMIKSFEFYLLELTSHHPSSKAVALISILHNLHDYFSQFYQRVQDQISSVRKPIEDKLRKFVKINSFDKDLSYFSTESSIKQVHRNLHKHLKEFELEIKKKISELFVYKDNENELNSYEIKEYQMTNNDLDPILFISNEVPICLKNPIESLRNISKHTTKSQTIVKDTLTKLKYSGHIDTINELIISELETCNCLRAQKVDENLPKSKQKSQAKSILNQKRKALTNFFKVMANIGINFRSGQLTYSLDSELADFKISPFKIEKLEFSNSILQNMAKNLSKKLDIYFVKSIFKMKLLTNILVAPRSDMDFGFIERIKGLSVELFALVQEQRKFLGDNVNSLIQLKQHVHDINTIRAAKNNLSFDIERKKFDMIQNAYIHGIPILEQFKLLMDCSPEKDESSFKVVSSINNNSLHKNSQNYSLIMRKIDDLLSVLQSEISLICSINSKYIIDVDKYQSRFVNIIENISELKDYFVIETEYSNFGQTICKLYLDFQDTYQLIKSLDKVTPEASKDITEDIGYLSLSILIAIQTIFKEYQHETSETSTTNKEDWIVKDLLKEKLHQNLLRDIQKLNIKNINETLSRIMNSIHKSATRSSIDALVSIQPLILQYILLNDYFFIQQLSAHKASVKMLSIMLSVFLELAKNGFCIPENLLSDEEQKHESDTKTGEGFGFEDGEGENNAADKLESEDQLDEAKKPDDYNKGDQEEKDVKEEKGIEMSENFEGKMQDVTENESDSENPNDEDNKDMDKEMGETQDNAEKLDDQIWGSDGENEDEQEEKDMKDEKGKGSGENDEQHNDLEAENDQNEIDETNQDGLDASTKKEENKTKKEQQKDIEKINDDDGDENEEQSNPHHNALEEPPEPEDFDLNNECNLDNDKEDKETEIDENPFDVDSMKEQEESKDVDDHKDEKKNDNKESNDLSDEDSGNEENEKLDDSCDIDKEENEEDVNDENDDKAKQFPDESNFDEEKNEDENNQTELPNDFHESQDKRSKEENIQSMPNEKSKGSHDQVQVENKDESMQQDQIDDQETGEDQDGIGQAENQESKSGHKGISDAKESSSKSNQENNKTQQKRKKGNTDEERTLGDVDKMEKKFLKTVEKLNTELEKEEDESEINENADEYQHIKDAKKNDKTTLDNATEDQSKNLKHEDDVKNDEEMSEVNDNLMETDEPETVDNEENNENLKSKKFDENSEKPSKKDERTKSNLERMDEVEVDGENVKTFSVSRGNDTTAHCQPENIKDSSISEELTNEEILEMRKKMESDVPMHKINVESMENWQQISNRMMSNARELCEQLRLILEPTKCTRLKGDYRTGRRINMKKIIPYIASQFRKDKIWLRRTKAAQRDYKIIIAVDDSKSMDHNHSKDLTLQTISLVYQALSLLESGKLSVVSFGESSKIILKYNDQFNGPKLISSLNFNQNKTRIAELLDFTRIMNQEDASSESNIFEHLLIVLSDGRNIFGEGEKKVRNAIKMARLQQMFLIYIIIDNPDNKDSILDIRTVLPFVAKDKTTKIVSYMDQFPFPYYVIVRDLNQLPLVLSEGLRQWFELVNNE